MSITRWLQRTMSGPGWDRFWVTITRIYSPEFFVGLFPVLYWVADRQLIRMVGSLFLLNIWLNAALKIWFWYPRPEPRGVRVIWVGLGGTDLGFPSSHAQGMAALWALLAWEVPVPWLLAGVAVVVILVGVSRLYLGVHWPQDVVGGWMIGLLVGWGGGLVFQWVSPILGAADLWLRVAAGALVPVLMLLAAHRLSASFDFEPSALVAVAGALGGFWPGTALEEAYLHFNPVGPASWQLQKLAAGLLIMLATRAVLKAMLPRGVVWLYARYVGLALAATIVSPLLFTIWSR